MNEQMPHTNDKQPEFDVISYAAKLQRAQRELLPDGPIVRQQAELEKIREDAERQLNLIQTEITALQEEETGRKDELKDIIDRMTALDDDEKIDEQFKDIKETILGDNFQVARTRLRAIKKRLNVLHDQKTVVSDYLDTVSAREESVKLHLEEVQHAMGCAAVANAALTKVSELDALPDELTRPVVLHEIIESTDLDTFRTAAPYDYTEDYSPGPIRSVEVLLPQQDKVQPYQDTLQVETVVRLKTHPPVILGISPKDIRRNQKIKK